MKPKDRMEVLLTPERIVRIEGEPHNLFAVVKALKEDGFDPQVRVIDPETDDWTCWQPTKLTQTDLKESKPTKRKRKAA
jgi:hypothetical protein